MDDIILADPSEMVLYEEEVTTAHEIDVGPDWTDGKSIGYELTDTKCYKTPSGLQKTATIPHESLSLVGKEQIVETDGEYFMDSTDFSAIPSTSAGISAMDPSTSSSTIPERQPNPLRRMGIRIGSKTLRFKVIPASEAPEAPPDANDVQWLEEAKPVTTPKSLAGLFQCTNCKTYFGNKEVYQRHMTEVHGDARPFRCFSCGMRFANKTSMTHHLKDHDLLMPMYSCEYCPRIFSKQENRNRHHKMHFTRMTCTTCMRFFTTQEALLNHQRTAHSRNFEEEGGENGAGGGDILPNGKVARFNCGYCNLRFHFKKDMLVHERVHTGEKPYSCGYCGKGFSQSQALTAHIRVHTKETPYGCSKCPKRFRDNSCLRKHELSAHTAEPIVRPVSQATMAHLQMQKEQRRKQQMIVVNRDFRVAP